MRGESDSEREAFIIVGEFRDRLDHALAAVRRLMKGPIEIARIDALFRRRPETGLLRVVFSGDTSAAIDELNRWATREHVGIVVPDAVPPAQRAFFFGHYLPQFRPLARSYSLPQTALCALTCALIGAPTPAPMLAEGTGARRPAVVLEWSPGVRRPRGLDRERCEMSGSIDSTKRHVTPTS